MNIKMDTTKNRIFTFLKRKNIHLPLLIILLLVITGSSISCNVAKDARALGRGLGNTYGKVIGNMKGSYEGHNAGKEAGEKDARVLEEPDISIEQKIQEQGKLHVMEVSMNVTDHMNKGEGKDTKVAILFTQKATADYSVDLACVAIEDDENGILITIPDVTAEIVDYPDTYEELDSYLGKDEYSEYAYDLRLNTDNVIYKKIESEFNEKNGYVKNQARETARKQIVDLAETLTGKHVTVQFITDEGNKND